jgi:transposase
MVIVAELHDFRRFHTPRALMAYLGLTPGVRSSADKTRRGGITKAGNSLVRRVLIEAAWHYRHKPTVSHTLRKRQEGQPGEVVAIARRSQVRLHRRFWKLVDGSKKPPNKVAVAIARELAGFIWAVLFPFEDRRAVA